MHNGFLIGEWEGETKIMVSEENGATYVTYAPVATYPSEKDWEENFNAAYSDKLHNTDPLFFGKRFYYANCLQYAKGYSYLKNIPNGSVILFGEHAGDYNHDSTALFRVECVFHVKSSITYSPENIVEQASRKIVDGEGTVNYKEEMLEKYFLSTSTLPLNYFDNTLKKRNFRLYFGSSYTPEPNKPYSFFPCKNTPFMTQPVIELTRFGFIKKHQYGADHFLLDLDAVTLAKYWRSIAETIVDQGFQLGVRADFL